ncbi:hypothetical protein ACXZ9C_11250 [Streptococcus agalactiae]
MAFRRSSLVQLIAVAGLVASSRRRVERGVVARSVVRGVALVVGGGVGVMVRMVERRHERGVVWQRRRGVGDWSRERGHHHRRRWLSVVELVSWHHGWSLGLAFVVVVLVDVASWRWLRGRRGVLVTGRISRVAVVGGVAWFRRSVAFVTFSIVAFGRRVALSVGRRGVAWQRRVAWRGVALVA